MVHRCASFRQKTNYYGFLDGAQSLYHESGNFRFHDNPRRPTTIRRCGAALPVAESKIERAAQPEKRAILSERHQLLPSEPGKRTVVLHESCRNGKVQHVASRLERSRAEGRDPNIAVIPELIASKAKFTEALVAVRTFVPARYNGVSEAAW
jgi:hypothetical protein